MGDLPDGPVCEALTIDFDCAPTLGNGIGGDLTIDANLILGNSAESGSGGGLRMSNINGTDAVNNPNSPSHWWHVTVTNNIIANNVAGWDGGGVSIQDALRTTSSTTRWSRTTPPLPRACCSTPWAPRTPTIHRRAALRIRSERSAERQLFLPAGADHPQPAGLSVQATVRTSHRAWRPCP